MALPLLIEAASSEPTGLDALLAALEQGAEALAARLHARGALLWRGFALASEEDFGAACRALGAPLAGYAGGDSPRTKLAPGIYTSTEYPAHLEIPLHNELSYAASWPERIHFGCLEAAPSGGETPLADGRALLDAIDPAVRARFEARGVRYLRHLHGGFGLGRSWQQTFETEDREEVERLCREGGIEFSWKGDALALCQVRPALATHPVTGETVWFNQADLWHVLRLGERRARALLEWMGEEALPQHATFGDGSPISASDLSALRSAQRAVEVLVSWRRGDFLVADNVLVLHGRRPFTGSRRVLVAMSGPADLGVAS